MSYEDLEKARADRAAKEQAKAKGKGKLGRKRKSPALEAEEGTAGKGKRGRKRKSPAPEAGAPEPKAKVARMIESPEPWKAAVAQMLPSGEDERSTGCGR